MSSGHTITMSAQLSRKTASNMFSTRPSAVNFKMIEGKRRRGRRESATSCKKTTIPVPFPELQKSKEKFEHFYNFFQCKALVCFPIEKSQERDWIDNKRIHYL